MKKKVFLIGLAVCLLFVGSALGQMSSIEQKQNILKKDILANRASMRMNAALTAHSPPPPGPVHCCAEWEESEGVMCLWLNADLINKLQMDNMVYIPVDTQQEKNDWITFLNQNGVPLTNIDFWFIPTDSIYTRDYGPWFIWDANNELGVVNYTCHYGFWDDQFPWRFCRLFDIKYYESGLDHVGGNWYPNAYGNAFSSTLIYWDNYPLTMDQTNALMNAFYGIERYNTVPVAYSSGEHHDTWGKPSNPETIIVGQFPEGAPYRPFGEGMADYYGSLESPWGRPYKIHRMPMMDYPPGSTNYKPYLNALVSNKKVFVAETGSPTDPIAFGVFQDAFPGYEITGVYFGNTSWGDSVHCRTRNFIKRDAIRIYPLPPGDTEDTVAGYDVIAEVIPPKGSTLLANYPKIFWTETGGGPFNEVVMTATGQPDEYAGTIPARPLDTRVDFYIEAKDDGSHSAIYPLVAPKGMMNFEVRADTEAPELSRFLPVRCTSAHGWCPTVRVLCKDDMATPELKIEYAVNGIPQPDVPLTRETKCYWYSGEMAGAVSPGDVVTYRVVATDNAASANTSCLPKVGEVHCPVSSPADVAVVDMCRRCASGPFIARTLGELDIPCTYYDAWPADWTQHDVYFISLGVYAYNYMLTGSQVRDIEHALSGGADVYLEGGDTWTTDPLAGGLRPLFGVQFLSKGYDLHGGLDGEAGSIVDGMHLAYAGENNYIDLLHPAAPAEGLWMGGADKKHRAVIYNEGSYRTIASSFSLGGLVDKAWPETRKEILLRYLDYFGVPRPALFAKASAKQDTVVPVELNGNPGDGFILLASLADDFQKMGGYGTLRLDASYLFILGQGVIPPSGKRNVYIPVPRNPNQVGMEVHLQAVIGSEFKPGKAALTNREILTIIE